MSQLTIHIAWSTKYRYSVLQGDSKLRLRSLLQQICESEDVIILKGVVSSDYVHMRYRPSQPVSELVKRFKGRIFRLLQQEFPELRKRYWVGILELLVMAVGVLVILLIKW